MKKYEMKWLAGIAGGVILVALAASSHTTIDTTDRGVVKSFGVVHKDLLNPGFHIIAPWDKVEMVGVQYTDQGFMDSANDQNANPDAVEISALTKDGKMVWVPLSIGWAINPAHIIEFKSRQGTLYTPGQIVIMRTAVRDAVALFTYDQVWDRDALAKAIDQAVRVRAEAYYRGMGFGEASKEMVFYGTTNVRGFVPSDAVVSAREKVITDGLEADALAAKTKVPAGRSTEDYTKVMQAQALAKATEDGKATINIITGDKAASAVIVGNAK